jgi:hypothetical protein
MNTMTREISKYDDVIDSRDVIERAGELAAQWTDHANGGESEALTDEERAELDALSALIDQGESAATDWEYGETLIRDSYFQEYAQELAEELDLINPNAAWPASCIDWEKAAWELRMDYTSVEFDGVTYWVR